MEGCRFPLILTALCWFAAASATRLARCRNFGTKCIRPASSRAEKLLSRFTSLVKTIMLR